MPLIFYGTKQIPVHLSEEMVKCPACETDQWADILYYSEYFHIYWLPVFPVDKKKTLVCNNCGLQRHGLEPSEKLLPNYSLMKKNFRHPWYTWSVILFIIMIIVYAILSATIK